MLPLECPGVVITFNIVLPNVITEPSKSDLPNDFFVQQFDLPAKKPFCDKKYWRSFAKILTSRKLENTPEIYKKLLIWLQDINWPGSDIIFNFVVENINDFSYSIKETLLEALYNNDDVWIISILTAVYKNKGLTNKEINGQLEKVQKLLINENNFENLIKLFDDILD